MKTKIEPFFIFAETMCVQTNNIKTRAGDKEINLFDQSLRHTSDCEKQCTKDPQQY